MFNDHHFLYVEDDMMSREIMHVTMKNMKVGAITIFEDSADFMERVGSLPQVPDVILLDIHMKPYTGFELLHMLRENMIYDDTRIIALTASVMNQEVQRLKDSGFDGAIAKPLDVETFGSLIARIIDGETVWHIA